MSRVRMCFRVLLLEYCSIASQDTTYSNEMSRSVVSQLFATPWTVSMELSRPEYWSV